MTVAGITSPFFYFDERVNDKRRAFKAAARWIPNPHFGLLPKEIQDLIFDYVPFSGFPKAVCRKFAAVWLEKAFFALAQSSSIKRVKSRSEEQKLQVANFFAILKKMPPTIVYPEPNMPTVLLMKSAFARLWSQIREGHFSDPLTGAVHLRAEDKFDKEGKSLVPEGRKFLRNVPSILLGAHSPNELKEMSERLEKDEVTTHELVEYRIFSYLMENGLGSPDNFCHLFFNTISPLALQKLMALFGNQNRFTFSTLVKVFKAMPDQRLACEKFIIFADAATPGIMQRPDYMQMEVALAILFLGDHFNQQFPEAVTLEKIRNWIPLVWQRTIPPCITRNYNQDFIQNTLAPVLQKLFSPIWS